MLITLLMDVFLLLLLIIGLNFSLSHHERFLFYTKADDPTLPQKIKIFGILLLITSIFGMVISLFLPTIYNLVTLTVACMISFSFSLLLQSKK